MWPKLGQGPILASEMLLLLGPNKFLAQEHTLVMFSTLGQDAMLRPLHFYDFEQNVSFFVQFPNFIRNQFGQILAKRGFLGQVWPEMKADVVCWPLEKKLSLET